MRASAGLRDKSLREPERRFSWLHHLCGAAPLFCLLMNLGSGLPASAQCRYTATTFRGPEQPVFGAPATVATALNNNDQVVGYYFFVDGPETGFVWSEQTGLVSLPAVSGGVRPFGINDAGRIVGAMGSTPGRAFLWDGEQYIDLGIPPGGNYSQAAAINERGQVVGRWGNNISGPIHGFLWENGVLTDLGPALGAENTHANDINDAGEIAGAMGSSHNVDFRATLLEPGSSLLVLPPVPGGYTSEGRRINNHGDISGAGRIPHPNLANGAARAFLWINGVFHVIEPFDGYRHSSPTGVNHGAVVVGTSSNPGRQPFIWRAGVLADLETLIDADPSIRQFSPYALDLEGRIVGSSNRGGTLLTPIRPSGDLNADCSVGLDDLLILLTDFGCTDVPCSGDVNNDGRTDHADLAELLFNWGR